MLVLHCLVLQMTLVMLQGPLDLFKSQYKVEEGGSNEEVSVNK